MALRWNAFRGYDAAVSGRLISWLIATLITYPAVSATLTLAAYLASNGGDKAGRASLTFGLAAGIPVAIAIGALALIFIAPQRANTYEYRELGNRIAALEQQLNVLAATPNVDRAAVDRARAYAPVAQTMFGDTDLRWAGGIGYLRLWTRIHQAEEALFMAMPVSDLLAEADRDMLRLKDSTVPQADDLRAEITAAGKALSPGAANLYLANEPASPLTAQPGGWERLARLKLQGVRQSLNTYRQSLWDGLVRARSQFVRALIATTVMTAVVVDLVVGRGTEKGMVVVAAILYLIGVLIGLFGRLQGLISSTSVEEDFGLDTSHLLAAPILSGVAAVVGVVLVALLNLKIGDVSLSPPTAGPHQSVFPAIFNLGTYPGALVIAALFGLTPEILVRYLKTQADRFTEGLSATETWGKGPAVIP